MVAEPVQATLETLGNCYNWTSSAINEQQNKFVHSEFYENVSQLLLAAQPVSPPPSPRYMLFGPRGSLIQYNQRKLVVASILSIGIGIGGIYYFSGLAKFPNGRSHAKRRAHKLVNGARRDVILIIGSPTEPLTRLIALDFERRGFIVYLTILDEKDASYVETNPVTDDIRYLNLSRDNCAEVIASFRQFLDQPVVPFVGADPHQMKLVGVVFAPTMHFPIGPIESISKSNWTRINDRITMFASILSGGLISLIRHHGSKTILLSSSIISDLNPPYQAPETLYQRSLQALFTSLTREIGQHKLLVTQVRLGNLRSSNHATSHSRIASTANSQVRSWDLSIRDLYANGFSKALQKSNPMRKSGGSGTNLVEMYHTLFDLIYSKKRTPPIIYCGTGARAYNIISRVFPESWIAFLLG